MTEMTAMQVYEGEVINLTGTTGNLNIIPLTKTNAHRATLIRRKNTDNEPVPFHFRKKSTGMHMYIHTYEENGVEKELKQADFRDWVIIHFKHPGYLEGLEKIAYDAYRWKSFDPDVRAETDIMNYEK